MRDITFRGQRVDGKGWIYGDLIHTPTLKKRIIYFVDISSDGVHDYEDFNYEVKPDSIGQFTNIQTKNEEPVYEGMNVLQHIKSQYLDESDWGVIKGIVKMIDGCWCVGFSQYPLSAFELELIKEA